MSCGHISSFYFFIFFQYLFLVSSFYTARRIYLTFLETASRFYLKQSYRLRIVLQRKFNKYHKILFLIININTRTIINNHKAFQVAKNQRIFNDSSLTTVI